MAGAQADLSLSQYVDMLDSLNPAERQKRSEIIHQLEILLEKWVSQECSNETCLAEPHGSRIVPFGGYQLGISTKASDIDLLCIVPRHINYESFFSTFPSMIETMPDFKKMRVVKAAFVPIIEATIADVEIDLSLTVFNTDKILPELDMETDDILHQLDDLSIRGLKGYRDCQAVLSLVPNVDLFRRTAKAVKYWAKGESIYGVGCGFPGGIAWSIMAAKVCQLYPHYTHLEAIMQAFFDTFHAWNWPKPVMLKPNAKDILKLSPWNAKVQNKDRKHVMPIISPSYPEFNTSFTVSLSSLKVCQLALLKGKSAMTKLIDTECCSSDLFSNADFQKQYKHYLVVNGRASSDTHIYDWAGLVQAHLRKFVLLLEGIPEIDLLHPRSNAYNTWKTLQRTWLVGIVFKKGVKINLDIAESVQEFNDLLVGLAKERAIFHPGMTLEVLYQSRKTVEAFITDSN